MWTQTEEKLSLTHTHIHTFVPVHTGRRAFQKLSSFQSSTGRGGKGRSCLAMDLRPR